MIYTAGRVLAEFRVKIKEYEIKSENIILPVRGAFGRKRGLRMRAKCKLSEKLSENGNQKGILTGFL